MATMLARNLGAFVELVDRKYLGNLNHSELASLYYPITLDFESEVNQDISPFSEAYFAQQLSLYGEISGRTLNQWDGELHPVDVEKLAVEANPLGIRNVSHVSEHVRALSSMLSLSALGESARVLDMGAGHGLSSEVFAFCGCQVHAIDIDPRLAELSGIRSVARGLNVRRSTLNFDNLDSIERSDYAAAFFFQSLHHCLRPWMLIKSLKSKLIADGIIGFTGEPIQSSPWRHWGLRLDHESLYVARKYGWFESGWSRAFIEECFVKAGLKIVFFDGGHAGGLMALASASTAKLDEVRRRASAFGFLERHPNDREGIEDGCYQSQTGVVENLLGASAYSTTADSGDGFLCYGPYVKMIAGSYRLSFMLKHIAGDDQSADAQYVVLDIIGSLGAQEFLKEEIRPVRDRPIQIIERTFNLGFEVLNLEARVRTVGGGRWVCSLPVFERISSRSPSA